MKPSKHKRRLTNAQVRAIRQHRHDTGDPWESIGERFGITSQRARWLCAGKQRADAGGPLAALERPMGKRGDLCHRTALSDEQVRLLRQARREGATWDQLAARFGVHKKTAYRLATGRVRPAAGGVFAQPGPANGAGVAVRCPGCGGKVLLPCILCGVRALPPVAADEPAEDDEPNGFRMAHVFQRWHHSRKRRRARVAI